MTEQQVQSQQSQAYELAANQRASESLETPEIAELFTPRDIKSILPITERGLEAVMLGRESIKSTLRSEPASKLIAVIGPCSIHDPEAALDYATWLKEKRNQYGDKLELIMRVYFEKPRTTIGWKGLINDPHLNESYDINTGLAIARKLLCDITDMGVPVGTELLDTITPHYIADLLSWGAVGARTTESQIHRQFISGLPFAIGCKNGTDGNVQIAIDAADAASYPHHFTDINDDGQAVIKRTKGNRYCHVFLRGGTSGTNYDEISIAQTTQKLIQIRKAPLVMVDFSHGNSGKDHTRQILVAQNIAMQIVNGSTSIMGVSIESNLKPGKQPFIPGSTHEYGKSITDACAGLEETDRMLDMLYRAQSMRQ